MKIAQDGARGEKPAVQVKQNRTPPPFPLPLPQGLDLPLKTCINRKPQAKFYDVW